MSELTKKITNTGKRSQNQRIRSSSTHPILSYLNLRKIRDPSAVEAAYTLAIICGNAASISSDAYPRTSVRTDYVHVTTPFAHQWRALFNSRFCIFLQILNYAGQIQMLVL